MAEEEQEEFKQRSKNEMRIISDTENTTIATVVHN